MILDLLCLESGTQPNSSALLLPLSAKWAHQPWGEEPLSGAVCLCMFACLQEELCSGECLWRLRDAVSGLCQSHHWPTILVTGAADVLGPRRRGWERVLPSLLKDSWFSPRKLTVSAWILPLYLLFWLLFLIRKKKVCTCACVCVRTDPQFIGNS